MKLKLCLIKINWTKKCCKCQNQIGQANPSTSSSCVIFKKTHTHTLLAPEIKSSNVDSKRWAEDRGTGSKQTNICRWSETTWQISTQIHWLLSAKASNPPLCRLFFLYLLSFLCLEASHIDLGHIKNHQQMRTWARAGGGWDEEN